MDAENTDVEDRENVTSVDDENETNGNNNSTSNIEPAYTKEAVTSKSSKTQHKTTTSEHTNTQASARNRNIETKPQTSPQSFTEISEDIERFLRRNHSGKGSFTAQI